MKYTKLLDLAADLGYWLTLSGAETFRVEESVKRILKAYGMDGEVFAIPSCIHVSIETGNGTPLTRMRRVEEHGNDLDAVERYSGLSRRICAEKPDPDVALQWLKETTENIRHYSIPMELAGHFMGACGFSVLFGGSWKEAICAGFCGLSVWVCNRILGKLGTNLFFKTIASAFVLALLAYTCGVFGLVDNAGSTVIGALMLLVPGLLVTNAMRDIIYGDTNSGVNRLVQVFLVAVALALGTAAAWNITKYAPTGSAIAYTLLPQLAACLIACVGFAVVFNIQSPGNLLCALGGVLTWAVYVLVSRWIGNEFAGYFWAAIVASVYSEIMARVRKYPAIAYLVVSIVPLIPGAGVYKAVSYAMQGQMDLFAKEGMDTAAIAGVLAVGILLVSTVFRVIVNVQRQKKMK